MGFSHVSAIFGEWSTGGGVAIDQFDCWFGPLLQVFYGAIDERVRIDNSGRVSLRK